MARAGEFESLEKVWLEEMATPGELSRYQAAIDALIETGQRDRASVLGGMLIEALDDAGREEEILSALQHLADQGMQEVSGIEQLCARCLRRGFGSEPWYEWLLEKAGVDGDNISWDGFLEVHRCMSFLPGRVVLHRSGWGEGRIEALHPDRDEVEIHFASGKRHTVPWQSALDTMDPLPAWDLRAMTLTDSESLARLVKERPIEIVRRALKIFRGKSTSTQLKSLLAGAVVPTRSWASWWKKAKAAAVEDPLIAVEGSSSRPTFTMRKKALSLAEEARAALHHETGVETLLPTLRSFLERATRDSDRDALAALAGELLGGIAASGSAGVDSVQALLFLEGLGQVTEQGPEVIRRFLCDGGDVPDYGRLARIPDPELRCRMVQDAAGVFGPGWHRVAAEQLARIPEDCEQALELLVERIRACDDPEVLIATYESLAPFPAKHPFLLYLLTKAWAEGDLQTGERKLDDNVVCRVVLHVLRVVSDPRTSQLSRARRSRLQARISTILTGRRGALEGLLANIDRTTMESCVRTARSGGPEFPPKVQELIDGVAHARFPELFQEVPRPFWANDDVMFCTREGYRAHEAEFHHLRDELIPANSKAIGQAASLGDLSENAEWEAAMEEQRTLTARAAEWEDELKRASFLEEQEPPEGVVAPGTRVTLRDLDSGEHKSIRILGSWDGVLGDDVISYRAPLAAGLLGARAGDEIGVELPTGVQRVRIESIEKIFGS